MGIAFSSTWKYNNFIIRKILIIIIGQNNTLYKEYRMNPSVEELHAGGPQSMVSMDENNNLVIEDNV